jgi:hypothetical protein
MAAFCGMRMPSFSEESNDTDTLLQISPTNSQSSSIGSLPWAEDSIFENKEEWEKIERIFYGEEDLPIGECHAVFIFEMTQGSRPKIVITLLLDF